MRMRWVGLVARMGEERTVYKLLMGKPEGNRQLGRPRCGCGDGIRMELGRLAGGWSGFTWLTIRISVVLPPQS
jgi:hypothetical protein